MNEVRMPSFRNVAIISSVGAGKTSLAEAILYTTGTIPALGRAAGDHGLRFRAGRSASA